MNKENIFWLKEPSILYKNDNYLSFIPKTSMTKTEQLNSISRLCIYIIIFSLLFNKKNLWLKIPIIILLFIIIIYYTLENNTFELINNLYTTTDQTDRQINRQDNNRTDELINSNDNTNIHSNVNSNEIESGYYDSNNKLHLEVYNSSNKNNILKDNKYTRKEMDKYNNATCRKPTIDNPFMNPNIDDYDLIEPPEPCNVDDDQIKNQISEKFYDNLFLDVSDLWERENSQRQFYTIPRMNPPDQTGFAKWLYQTDNICKVDQSKCMKYEDVRTKRNMMYWG